MRLLVVDDDAVFRQELGDLLEQDGNTVVTAASVPKALEALAADGFDLVFTDLKMPRHSGLELLREVRARWPRTLVVMITGFATIETAVEAMKVGAFDYVQKPFKIEQIHLVIELADQEIKFQGRGEPPAQVAGLVRRWSEDGLAILRMSPNPGRPAANVTAFATPAEPTEVRDHLESFLHDHPHPGVLLEGVDRLFEGRPSGHLVPFVRSLRERLGDLGPLVVTYDPSKVTVGEGEELRAALAAPVTQSTLEALSNPIRRAVLQRAGQGTISFTQAMESAQLDDSPKLSFHLRRLVEEGLLGHVGDQYRISARGEESLRLLARWDSLAASAPSASAALPIAVDAPQEHGG
jgi:ActR/RegA family two-component response regulator